VIDLQDARVCRRGGGSPNAQIGTVVHRLLAKLDFCLAQRIAPENILRNLEEQIVPFAAQASSMKAKRVSATGDRCDFLQTPIGEKLLHAEEIHAKRRFWRIPQTNAKNGTNITRKFRAGMMTVFVSGGTFTFGLNYGQYH
jgi:hypothetical protein